MSAKQCTHVHVHAYTPEPGILGSMKRVRVCHLCYVLGVMCYVPQPLEQRCSYSFELESLEGEAVCVLGGGWSGWLDEEEETSGPGLDPLCAGAASCHSLLQLFLLA